MILKKLKVVNFRNLKNVEVDFIKVNILYGENAQGKTNLIESIYYLLTGRSFRTFFDKELIKWGEEYAYIKGNLDWQEQDILIESALNIQGEKRIKINQKTVKRQKELVYLFPVVIFTQDDIQSIKDEPLKRRQMFDRFLSILNFQYYKNLLEYNKILYQRNIVLKSPDKLKDLDVWDNLLIEKGSNLIYHRLYVLKELERYISEISKKILGREALKVKYICSFTVDDIDLDSIKRDFEESLSKQRKEDINKKYTSVGPHRDDIIFYWLREDREYSLRNFGSGGERKIAFLIWKLSELKLLSEKRREKAILLIDDLFAELDDEKKEIVWNSIKDFQVFITTAYKLKFLEDQPYFEINSGKVTFHEANFK